MRIASKAWITTLAVVLILPLKTWACDFAYRPSSALFEEASAIFVGKVVESPWKRAAGGETITTNKRAVRFAIQKKLRGIESDELVLPFGDSDCVFAFLEGETYLVHANRVNGKLDTGSPWRPLVLAEGTEELKYVEQTLAGKNPGLLYGVVLLGSSDAPVFISASANLSVRLEGPTGRFQARAKPGYYEIVAPPGNYEAWLELNGKVLSQKQPVRLTRSKATFQRLEGSDR